MKSGKLDEELGRMSDLADHVVPSSMVLFNESFAATNEREGSEIARQIVRALLEKGIKVLFVTHLYEFAHGFLERNRGDALFLRAERKADGTRTFRVVEGEPLETSYGQDLYKEVFESAAAGDGAGGSARRDGVAPSAAGTDAHEGTRRVEKVPEEATSEERKE
jgi:DNA mismatch repair ATPase MutS